MASDPLFAFFGSSVDSQYALEQLERVGLSPALVVRDKTLPPELYNTAWDFFLVASYGTLLKKEVLALPKHGCLNIHPSLLPKFRGPSPYVSAILAEVLPDWLAGTLEPVEQDDSQATYTKKFSDADALLDLNGNQREQFLKVQAFDKNPRAYFINAKNKRVIVTEAEFKEGKLEISKVIPEGKKEMPYQDYLRGQK